MIRRDFYSMPVVISIENLSKYYRLGLIGGGTLRADVNRWFAELRNLPDPSLKIGEEGGNDRENGDIWAVRDVNLEVRQGEILGIIGRNGAGKSTLLKLLSQITAPTEGIIKINGRVGSLLEVGTGFHPELTGRENIYLNGTILGMTRVEVSRKLEDIIEFAEIDKFVDTPVKRYSSGMTVRLAFAVAAHLEPEILVIDEVLAVGDAAFQKKCLGKMEEFAGNGRTVLFVSHNMQAISALTTSCAVFSNGSIDFKGETSEAIDRYLSFGHQISTVYINQDAELIPKITHIKIKTTNPGNVQEFGERMIIEFCISTPRSINDAALSFQIIDSYGSPVTHLLLLDAEIPMARAAGDFTLSCEFEKTRLYIGRYSLNVHFAEGRSKTKLQTIISACQFEVVVHSEIREYYWQPGSAKYIEDAVWTVQSSIWPRFIE